VNSTSAIWLEIRGNTSYTTFHGDEWRSAYTADLVQYGDLYLAYNETAVKGNMTDFFFTPTDFGSDMNVTEFRYRSATMSWNVSTNGWLFLPPLVSDTSILNGVNYAHIDFACGRNVPTRSRIQLSLRFMVIVILCNAVKLGMMLWVLLRENSDFIVTIGDGVASYLDSPDPNTKALCVLSKDAIVTMVGPHHVRDTKRDMLGDIINDAYGIWNAQHRKYSSSLDRDRGVGSSFM
jgi:hypothetical protein